MSTYRGTGWSLHVGSSEDVLPSIAADSIDALITDPPAGIGFMGKTWDSDKGGRDQWIAWLTSIMRECYRAMKPGAHGLVWALPRTSHWTATACEDAGFEIRDVVMHLFGTGFPKSLDVSKAIDAKLGAAREVIGPNPNGRPNMVRVDAAVLSPRVDAPLTAPGSPEAAQWSGWGTALKPAAEHWVLIRKPLIGTVAANVLRYGTGGINVDGCRIGTSEDCSRRPSIVADTAAPFGRGMPMGGNGSTLGRWPANVTLDEEAAAELDEQSAPAMHGAGKARDGSSAVVAESYDASAYELPPNRNMRRLGDSGGASRFFYVAKASAAEKSAGLDARNDHPTVKSIALMRWLTRLITPPGGTVLDPFAGSGTTMVAARMEGAQVVGIEQDPGHADKAARRVRHWAPDGVEPIATPQPSSDEEAA